MRTISATRLARNTGEILDLVADRGEVVIVERNRAAIVQITAPKRSMTAAQALPGLEPVLSQHKAIAWLNDSSDAFDESVTDPSV